MIFTILLIIFGIVFILALLYIVATIYEKHYRNTREKYQEHIDDLVQELFPPATDNVQPTIQAPDIQETKNIMVANVRRYFNRRKVDAAIAKTPVKSYEDLTYPSPPSHPEDARMISPTYPHNGTILGRFPGRYTWPKTGIFPRSQYKVAHTPKLCIKAYSHLSVPSSPKVPYIASGASAFTHGEISQKFFRKNLASYFFTTFSQVARTDSALTPQNPPKPLLCSKTPVMFKNPCYVGSRRNFSKKIFSKKIPKKIPKKNSQKKLHSGRLRRECAFC